MLLFTLYRWWPERRRCNNATSSSSSSLSESAVERLGSLHLGDLGGLFIALAVTLVVITGVSVAQWFWCRRSVPAERRNKSTSNRLPLSQLRHTVTASSANPAKLSSTSKTHSTNLVDWSLLSHIRLIIALYRTIINSPMYDSYDRCRGKLFWKLRTFHA